MTSEPTNQPTNILVDPPNDYYSLRVTTNDQTLLETKILYDLSSYIMYPHTGQNDIDPNPHYHILIIGDVPIERLRKRVRDHIGGGNKYFSGKSNSNGLLSGLTYCSHEDTTPVFKGPEPWQLWITEAPKWEPKLTQTKIGEKRSKVHEDHFRQITFRNMLKIALRWKQDRKIQSEALSVVLAHMIEHGNYMFDVSVLRNGIPAIFEDQFKTMCGGETTFRPSRIKQMFVVERWKLT